MEQTMDPAEIVMLDDWAFAAAIRKRKRSSRSSAIDAGVFAADALAAVHEDRALRLAGAGVIDKRNNEGVFRRDVPDTVRGT